MQCLLTCWKRTKIPTATNIRGYNAHDTDFFGPPVKRTARHSEVREAVEDKAYPSK